MPSTLLVMFILQLSIYLINTFGASTINDLLWNLYSALPFNNTPAAQKQQQQKQDLIRLKKELNSVSAQDDFAKWARLRRQHDKAEAEYNKSANNSSASRTQFNTIASSLRRAGTTGLRFLLQFWFSKTPMFWLPAGWVPWYVEWILSFPRAPMGAVSVQVWGIACGAVIALVGEAVTAVVKIARGQGQAQGKGSGVKVEMEAMGQKGQAKAQPVGMGGGAKKEL